MNTDQQYEILSAIDKIDQVTMEAETRVISALIETYSKTCMILENYEGEDYSCFDIFQEGKFGNFIDKMTEKTQVKEGESIIRKMLLLLPRLILKLVNTVRNKITDMMLNKAINGLTSVLEGLENANDADIFVDLSDDEFDITTVEFASDCEAYHQEGLLPSKNKPKNTSLGNVKSKDDQLIDFFSNLKNIDPSNKKQVGLAVMKLAHICANSRSEMETCITVINKAVKCISDIGSATKKFEHDLKRCSPDEKDAIEEALYKFIDEIDRMGEWAGKVSNREDSVKKIQSATDAKTIIKETLYMMSGLAEYVVKLKTSPAFKEQTRQEIVGGLNEAIRYLDSIGFIERTNDSKSKIVRILNLTNKLTIEVNNQLNNTVRSEKAIVAATDQIMKLTISMI